MNAAPPRRPLTLAPTILPGLPDACLQIVFDALSARPATACTTACAAAATAAHATPPLGAGALAAVCRRLSNYHHADHVTALAAGAAAPGGPVAPRDVAAALARFPRVRELRLRFHGRAPFDIAAALAADGCPHRARGMTSVELQGVQLPPAAVREIAARCPRLAELSLPHCCPSISDGDVLAVVSQLSVTLNVLALGSTGKLLTDAAGVQLANLSSLSSLNLSGCSGLTDVTFASLAALGGTLQELYLSNTEITDADAACIAHFPVLRVLDLGGCARLSSATLPRLPSGLSTVNVQVTSVLHDGLGADVLDALPALADLDASYAEDLTSWVPLERVAPRPRALDVSLSALADRGGARATLASMQALRHLNLSYCAALGDEAARGVAELPRLESLRMSFTGVGDAGVRALGAAKSRAVLRELDLSWCERITDRRAALAILTCAFTRHDVSIVLDCGGDGARAGDADGSGDA